MGHISIFNNCNNCAVRRSAVKEYELDEANKVATLIWYYEHPDVGTEEVYARASGSAQKLPNGNWFINWGLIFFDEGIPSMTEVDTLGHIVWEMTFDSAGQKSFRAHRYVWEPCGPPVDSTIVVNHISTDSVLITWKSPNGTSGYDFAYKEDTAVNWISYPVSGDSVLLTDLIPETVYDWRLKTYCESFNGDSSEFLEKEFTTIGTSASGSFIVSSLPFSLYPNPANEAVSIALDLESKEDFDITIVNLVGEVVSKTVVAGHAGLNPVLISLKNLPKGPYMIEVSSQNRTARSELIIQ
jgi:hypothetical protein